MPEQNEGRTPDLSRIVSLIMENPKLIEEISRLADADAAKKPSTDGAEAVAASIPQVGESVAASADTTAHSSPKERRAVLLSALKPYLSSERSRAIDSMMSVAEVLSAMKPR